MQLQMMAIRSASLEAQMHEMQLDNSMSESIDYKPVHQNAMQLALISDEIVPIR